MSAVYTTREAVMRSPNIQAAAHMSAEVDRAIASASRMVDRLCHRGDHVRPGFAPWTGTITFDWPAPSSPGSWKLWLDNHSLISVSALTSGGVSIPLSDVLLRPIGGPPYSRLELDRAEGSAFSYGSGVGQGSLAITGVWGFGETERTALTWQLDEAVSSSAEQLTINAPLHVGHTVRLGDERMLIVERSWADSGATGSLTASNADQVLTVTDGSLFLAGEELLMGAERMLIRDIAGDDLIVRRAVGGSTLAAHSSAAVHWSRVFTVQRGALGTTAAAHDADTQIYVHVVPGPVEELTRAYALDAVAQGEAGYARTVGSAEAERQAGGGAIRLLEERVYGGYARKGRTRAV